jgi:hypothetical protein
MISCLLLMAGFCFSGHDVQAHMTNFGMGYTVEVTTGSYKAEFAGTDVMLMHDYRKAPTACAEGACDRYFKFCADQTGGAVKCVYHLTWAGLSSDGAIVITAKDHAALATAESEIQNVISPGDKQVKIPLSLMTVLAPSDDIAVCPSDKMPTECNPG